MVYTHNYNQPNLLGFSSFGFRIEDTELVRLCQQINWNELIEIFSKAYSHKTDALVREQMKKLPPKKRKRLKRTISVSRLNQAYPL
jgi:hypothetical protein